ncbi:DNA adenine methylase [Sediminibacterium soli]|uniref:DNA adenine methylase n=1 Tax=Sediminibacterium soli TaxID=2698829 RepID=UPI00137B0DE9|nr:DNA adenine methylase [Sediminibacterium soli]NCI46145.1 DNA adenine methylase [Sediminibacterium soli]
MVSIANKSKKFYSPLRYPGGKACLSEFLADLIVENDLSDCTYVEPYAGGAGAALTLLMLEKIEQIIINDFDPAIYSFWKSVVDETDRFIKKIKTVPLTMDEWSKQKKIYSSKTTDSFKLGFATFYLNRTNRSGIIEGGVIGGNEQLGQWGIDARFHREHLVERIEKIGQYRNRIKVTNKDGISLIKQLKNKSKIFAYLDPPYYVKGSSLYLNHYRHNDHQKLAKILNENADMNWILTYDNVSEISSLYADRSCYEFSLNYHANKAKKGEELLVLSDNLTMPLTYPDNLN